MEYESCNRCAFMDSGPVPRILGRSSKLLIASFFHPTSSPVGHGAYRLSYKDKDDSGGIREIVAFLSSEFSDGKYDQASWIGCQVGEHDSQKGMAKCYENHFDLLRMKYDNVFILDRNGLTRSGSVAFMLKQKHNTLDYSRANGKGVRMIAYENTTYVAFSTGEDPSYVCNLISSIVKLRRIVL